MTRAALLAALCLIAWRAEAGTLRVCADPNNLPFSNDRGEGFENKIVGLIAADLGDKVEYTWWAQRRGFVRNTLKANLCDLWPGVASGMEMLGTTRPYYRSTFVFVTRPSAAPPINSFDDPRLRKLRIGVQMIGNDAMNPPPAHALARRGIIGNVRGFMLYGDYAQPSPAASIVQAVGRGDIDVAIVWGPLAGYFAAREKPALTVTPVPVSDGPQWSMVYDIAMGIRRGEPDTKSRFDTELVKLQPRIAAILASYHVPIVAEEGESPSRD